MPSVREPLLKPVPITELRPTQITVGMREVKAKRKRWREEGDTEGRRIPGQAYDSRNSWTEATPLCH